MRDRVGAHRAAEDQQDRGEDRRLYHRQGDPGHDAPFRGVQNGGRFLKVGVHIPENAADQDVGERRIVKPENDKAGEEAFAPPDRHVDAEERGQKAVRRSGDLVGVEEMLPYDRQRPLRHDIGENENRADIFFPREIRPGDQEGDDAAEEDRDDAGADREVHGV